MARYSAFLGRRVEVQYRAGDICLPASGVFVADSGRSIFLEQHLEQKGQQRHFRWEIPYQYIVRIEEDPKSQSPSQQATPVAAGAATPLPEPNSAPASSPKESASAAGAGGGASAAFIGLPNRPKTA